VYRRSFFFPRYPPRSDPQPSFMCTEKACVQPFLLFFIFLLKKHVLWTLDAAVIFATTMAIPSRPPTLGKYPFFEPDPADQSLLLLLGRKLRKPWFSPLPFFLPFYVIILQLPSIPLVAVIGLLRSPTPFNVLGDASRFFAPLLCPLSTHFRKMHSPSPPPRPLAKDSSLLDQDQCLLDR